MPILT
ncbi:37e2e800-f0db-4775-b542-36197c3945a1 [Thermothielavioides terrestris]